MREASARALHARRIEYRDEHRKKRGRGSRRAYSSTRSSEVDRRHQLSDDGGRKQAFTGVAGYYLAAAQPGFPSSITVRDRTMSVDLTTHFQLLARYNRIANERLFAACAQLDDAEYRKHRAGSFGSIHGLLNHILLGDRRWMGLFENGERVTRLSTRFCTTTLPACEVPELARTRGSSRSLRGWMPLFGAGR